MGGNKKSKDKDVAQKAKPSTASIEERVKKIAQLQPPDKEPFQKDDESKIERHFRFNRVRDNDVTIRFEKRLKLRSHERNPFVRKRKR